MRPSGMPGGRRREGRTGPVAVASAGTLAGYRHASVVAVSNQPDPPSTYYRQLDSGRYLSTEQAQGAWSGDEQHMAPVSALLTHALDTCSPRTDLVLSRVAFDILGRIPAGEVAVTAKVLRPGRTIELVEAEMTAGSRTVVRATAWRLALSDTATVAATDLSPIAGPEAAERFDMSAIWPGGFIRSVEARALGERAPGRSTVWLRSRVGIVDGVPTSEQAGLIGLIDTANGVAVRAQPGDVLFPNTDLTVHLFRRPTGVWLGLETEVSFGPDGLGLTSAVLHDLAGPFGRSAQTLTVRLR